MNIFSIIGLIVATIVFFFGLRLSSEDLGIFLDGSSAFIVFGGTFAAAAVSFQLDKIFNLVKIFFMQFIGGEMINNAQLIRNIMQVCEKVRSGESVENLSSQVKDPFLKESIQLIADGILDESSVIDILTRRASQMTYLRLEDVRKVKTLGKFPPAFGMMGTTIGMIVLLSNLGGQDAMKIIGPAMAVCLITTMYGVALANLVIIPIGENLEELARQSSIRNNIIIDGVKHIMKKSNPIFVAEDLNSFLNPSERLDWKNATS